MNERESVSYLSRMLLFLFLVFWGGPTLAQSDESDAPTDARGARLAFPFSAQPTDCIRRGDGTPLAEIRVTIERSLTTASVIVVRGVDGVELSRGEVAAESSGRIVRLPIPMPPEMGVLPVDVVLQEGENAHLLRLEVTRPDPDWVLHFIPGFHYDPVWWNTQEHYTETGKYMDAHVGPGIELVGEYLDILALDPDYRVAFHQLPYLKSFLEARPWRREELLAEVASGRVGIVGGTYNELASTLIGAEAVIRNAAYGTLWQRSVLGTSGEVFWQCDVFGHDPSFPSLMAQSGHRAGVFGRGPFHQWGTDRDRVNFPSEFMWAAPDGQQILTHYLTGHYGYAYAKFASGSNRASDDPTHTRAIIASMFEDLKQPALTHHVLLPMHMDFIRPLENLGDLIRDWNETYLAPRAVIDNSKGFFDAVEAEIEERDLVLTVITRDMNPIYTGCGVSFADLKIAEREVEAALREAEIFATIAAIEGAEYPQRSLDRAWRQLIFHAHHDAVTGSSSDQVYIDLLWGMRDALEIAHDVRFAAQCFLANRVDGVGPLLWNSVAHMRSGWWVSEDVQEGRGALHHADLPALGVRRLEAEPLPSETPAFDSKRPVLVNEHLRVEFDLTLGGAMVSVIDRATGEELLDGPGNDVVLCEEYAVLPGHGEGPWHLSPTGKRRSGIGVTARMRRDPARPHRIEIEARYPEFTKLQTVELLPGESRIDCVTTISRWQGRNQLLRVEFPFRHPGARPIFQTAAATIGRPFARDVDTAVDPWTLDQTTGQWVGLGAVATIEIVPSDGPPIRRAIGVGEIVIDSGSGNDRLRQANELALALVSLGVTTTITRSEERRYGDLDDDSNVPDFRIFLGSEEELRGTQTLVGGAPPLGEPIRYAEPQFTADGTPLDIALPTLWVRADAESRRLLLTSLTRDRAIVIPSEASRLTEGLPSVADRGIAVVNRGAISCRVEPSGKLAVHLLRSCTSWPAGLWIDPPERAHPDGSPLGAMHGTHRFEYTVIPYLGDHRDAEIAARGQEVQYPPLRQLYREGDGSIPDGKSWLSVEPASVLLTALKPAGFESASWAEESVHAPVRHVVARIWNGSGIPTTARVRPGFRVIRVTECDFFEGNGDELSVDPSGEIEVQLAPYAMATLLMVIENRTETPERLLLPHEKVIVSSPWLENRGEGVEGNGVFSITPRARSIVITSEGGATSLHLFNGHRSRTLTVPLTSRGPAALEVVLDPPQVEIPPGGEAVVQMTIIPREPWTGRSAIEISGVLEEGSHLAAVWVHDPDTAADAPVVEWLIDERLAVPRGELRARVRNLTDGPLRGVASWISPQPAWRAVMDWREELDLPPNGEVEFRSRLSVPIDSFVIPRFTAAGEIAYGESIALLESRDQVLLSFDVDRVRIAESGVGIANVTARARRGLTERSQVLLDIPDGWTATEVARDFTAANEQNPVHRLVLSFAIGASAGGRGGPLVATGPGRSHAAVDTTVAPAQRALPAGDSVTIDGEFDEWEASEFTSASGTLGSVQTAVRFDSGGLTLAMDVADATFRQTQAAATIWEGDSVQFALTAAPGTDIGYSSSDLEFGAAKTPNGPLVWCWYAGPDGKTGRVDEAEVVIVPYAGGIRYEFRIPRTRLPGINLEPGGVLGFSYIANDDDGNGYRGATEWTGGMTGTKDSSQFGELLLVPR